VTPYYSDDAVTIYHGDCRDILPGLPNNVADLLVTDPPYGIDFRSQAPGGMTVRGDGTHVAVRMLREALFYSSMVLRADAHVLLFSGWQGWPAFQEATGAYFTVRNALIWHKGGGGAGNILANYIRDYEVILYAAGYEGRDIGGVGAYSSVLTHKKVGRTRTHPTEKPVDLLRYLVDRHAPSAGLVLDPFMGSGSTLVAAREAGRKAIGVEIEERYCEAAAQRCQQEVLGLVR
jgi:DNA modification methylase